MAITPFKKVRAADPVIEQLQIAIQLPLKDISSRLILDGQLLKDIPILTGQTNVIDHKLQRSLVGYFVVRNSANSVIWDSQGSNGTPDLNLKLLCSADTTVSLWVF